MQNWQLETQREDGEGHAKYLNGRENQNTVEPRESARAETSSKTMK